MYTASAAFNGTTFWSTKEVEIPALGHDWTEVTYTWAGDNSSCTALKACNRDHDHDITETVQVTEDVTTLPGCETAGEKTLTAAFTKPEFEVQTKTVSIPATGHTPGETVVENEDPATCELGGHYDEVVYCTACGAELSRTTINIDPLGHDWAEITYTWSEDNSCCTALKACNRDHDHDISETVQAAEEVTKTPGCEEAGEKTLTAAFTKPEFTAQTKVVEIPALGHDWDQAVYTWADDNSSVTAFRACNRDHDHDITETVYTTNSVTLEPGCETAGTRTYTAVFTSEAFTTQTRNEEIAALGHDWVEITYTWAEDNSSCTALKACNRDHSHDMSETASASSEVTQEPTGTQPGVMTYTAEFDNPEFETQTRTAEIPVKEVASIAIQDMPKTEYNAGEELDVTGGTVLVTYADGETAVIEMTPEMVYGFSSAEEGEHVLTVIYGGAETTYTVNVTKNDIEVITFESGVFTEGENYFIDGNTVTVVYEVPCKVGYYDEEQGRYVALDPAENEDGSYSFTAPDGVTEVLLVVKGDATGDGSVNLGDAARIKAYFRKKVDLSKEEEFAADINCDGSTNLGDAANITAVFRKKYTVEW